MDLKKFEVPIEKLRWECDPKLFDFACTKDLSPLKEFIGQDRAIRAVEIGLNIVNSGYNIYVAGLTGTGKTSMVKSYIEKLIKEKEERGETFSVQDWCYIYNFKDLDNPSIVSLPQGQGKVFRDEMTNLLNKVRQGLGQTFSSEEYKTQRQKIIDDTQAEQQKLLENVSSEALHQGFTLQMTPAGIVFIPMKGDRPMQQQEYLALDDNTRKDLESKQADLRKKLQANLEAASNIQVQVMERLEKSDKEIGDYTVSSQFSSLYEKYAQWPKIIQYLTDLKAFILDKLEIFKTTEEPIHPVFKVPMSQVMGGKNPFIQFEVNVFVDNSEITRSPVIVETNPNFGNIFGKIERKFLLGGYISDHTMLKAGALEKANGGYLLLSAQDVLMNPGVWPALKRAIKTKEVRIEDPYEQFGLIAPQGIKAEPMPLKVKVILTGDTRLYQLLSMYDEDFWEIFKIKADFNNEIEKTTENILAYAAFLGGCCEECEAKHFDASGVAKIIEYSSRIVDDQEKLSSRFALVKDWIEEASYWAAQENSEYISARHVQKAIEERIFRHNLADEKMNEMIGRGSILIDVDKAVVGQLNGLRVYSLGDIAFGKPSRITAQTFLGRGGVINIERESDLSGPIHNKGVMILGGYLGWKYAQDKPLSLSASLCFEQSYGGVDGDSASSTELYAILSSLSNIPIKQNIAVTGSVNQKGEIQPIGGVNQKIEGFFKVCQTKGLTGEQGVLIPHQNVVNLMLREEVIENVRKGLFHIYSAKTIDEGIEILTGVPAGERQKDGTYSEGSINFLVDKQLREMAERLKGFYAEEKKEDKTLGPVKNPI
ncbi:MAG: AAA family ATPase [Smithella sp.]